MFFGVINRALQERKMLKDEYIKSTEGREETGLSFFFLLCRESVGKLNE